MSKPNPFRTKRTPQPPSATATGQLSSASPSQLNSPSYGGDFIASAFFEPGPSEDSSRASPSYTSPHAPQPHQSSLASSDPSHRRQHKTVRIASPPVSVTGVAAGFGSGGSTPTYLSPVLSSVVPLPPPTFPGAPSTTISPSPAASSAAVAAGHSLTDNITEEHLVQRDPEAPFQTLTPRPGSPPPEPVPDPFDTAEAAAVKKGAIEEELAEERERYAASVFDSVASTMERTTNLQRPMSKAPAPAPSVTKRGQGQRQTMDVDAFKRMLLTGDTGEDGQGTQAQVQGQENTKQSGGHMDVDAFKRMLLTGDAAGDGVSASASASTAATGKENANGANTTTTTTTTPSTPHTRQTSSSLPAPTVPLPRRSPSTRQKQASGEDVGRRAPASSVSAPGEKPPPPPPRARHGRTVSANASNALPVPDDSRRRSLGLSRSTSGASSSSIPSIKGATPPPVPSPPAPRVSRSSIDAETSAAPSSPPSTSATTLNHTSSPSLSRSPSILSSIDEPPHESLSIPSISEEPTSPIQPQGQRRPPTPPLSRRTSQYRRSVRSSKGASTLSPGTASGGATATVGAGAGTGPRPPPPPSPRPRARMTSTSSSIQDEEGTDGNTASTPGATGAGDSRSSSFSLTRNTVPEEGAVQTPPKLQLDTASTTTPTPSSEQQQQQQQQLSTPTDVANKRQSLPPPRPPPPRRRVNAQSISELPSQSQQQRETELPSRPRSLKAHRRTASGSSSSRGPPPPPPPPPAASGRHDSGNDKLENTEGAAAVASNADEKTTYTPSHAADVLADLTRLQQEVDAYRMKSAT